MSWTLNEAVMLALIGFDRHRDADRFVADLREYGFEIVALEADGDTEGAG